MCLVRQVHAWKRPLLRVHLSTNLHVDQLHLFTVLQSLTVENGRSLRS